MNNPVQQQIKKMLQPMVQNIRQDIIGYVVGVSYIEQTVDVMWKDHQGHNWRESRNVPLPQDGDGIFRESVEIGNRVSIAFRGGKVDRPYISVVHKDSNDKLYDSSQTRDIPPNLWYM
ncbi:hypothetical protein_gp091 [Bacillus phage vB_BceM_WH1]|nr:hypothetical protein_gp091 [Bacillus phage vB_BceM_WH1]